MPLTKRTGFFARHPLLVASTAASGGVLLGAYVAIQIFASPVEPLPPPSAPPPVAEAKATNAVPETTGTAPSNENVASVDRCEGQTWPNLTRDCMGQMQSRRAERADKPAPETPAPAPSSNQTTVANTLSVPSPPHQPQPAPPSMPEQAQAPAQPTTQAIAAPANSEPVTNQQPSPQEAAANANAAKDQAKAEKRKLREAKRKAKKLKSEEIDDPSLAFAPGDDRESESADRADRYERRSLRAEGRSRRERVIVRGEDDDGDSASERGGRRVIVIQRGAGESRGERGGFGGLFGGGVFGD